MPKHRRTQIRVYIFGTVLMVLLLCGTAGRSAYILFNSGSWANHTTEVISEIDATRAAVERVPRIDGSRSLFQAWIADVRFHLDRLQQITRDNPVQQQYVAELSALVSDTATSTEATRTALLGEMRAEEDGLLRARVRQQTDATHRAASIIFTLCVVLLLLGIITTLMARIEFRRSESAESALILEKQELLRHTTELGLVSSGCELIQSACDLPQLDDVVRQIAGALHPGSTGFFGLMNHSTGMIEPCSVWGPGAVPDSFPPDHCLALRLRRKFQGRNSTLSRECNHLEGSSAEYVCIPVHGPTGILGILHIQSTELLDRKQIGIISVFAAHVGLGLANLRMRESLLSQSIRDPLTDLYNRRYFDDVLDAEISAFLRYGRPLSLLLIDLDHFKAFNDVNGHVAGDDALRALAEVMKRVFRGSDVVCRYGGEEFGVLLIGTSLDDACKKAESFRQAVEQIQVSSGGQNLGAITATIGVADATGHRDREELVRAADVALYEGKRAGRNITSTAAGRITSCSYVSVLSTAASPEMLAIHD